MAVSPLADCPIALFPAIDSTLRGEVRTPAILGGAPAFAEPLHVGRPNIGNRESLQSRIDAMLDRRWLTNDGPLVREFEQRVAAYLGVKHCVTTCNGTIALMLAIRGLDMKGEVIIPSFTFVATAHALQWQEITPVFCDIDPNNHNLDPREIERHITPRTTGIMGVHLWGRPCDISGLEEIARRRNLKLLFDASHAFGCSYRGGLIGRFGDAEVFSFHATKFLNAFEGGAVVTNNDELAKKLRLMRNFGFTGYDAVEYIGTNAKMPEVCAAMGLTGMESVEGFIAVNRRNYFAYRARLGSLPGVKFAAYNESERNNFQYIILEIDPETCPLTRDELLATLHAENVLARRYFYPGCHRMEPYKSYFPTAGLSLPETIRMSGRVLALPTGTAIGTGEIETVADVIRGALDNAARIKNVLAERAAGVAAKAA
jgi:dTDP-4-amino-4,6-dideoxygalactose transaminase